MKINNGTRAYITLSSFYKLLNSFSIGVPVIAILIVPFNCLIALVCDVKAFLIACTSSIIIQSHWISASFPIFGTRP